MLDLRRGLAGNHGYSSDSFGRLNGSYESRSNIDFGTRARRNAQNYENCGYLGGGGIEFEAQTGEDEGSGPSSPPLWKTSPATSPTPEASLLHHHHNHHYRHQNRYLSPTSRSQAIARGRREMMEMVHNMPESSYELSLKDLVEQSTVQDLVEEGEMNGNRKMQSEKGKKKSKKNDKKRKIVRSESMENGALLLKMFFPISLGSKKKNSTKGTCAKVSPKPPLSDVPEKGVDKEWWKKRFSVASDNDNGGTSSSGSSGSSNSSRSRRMSGCLSGLWSSFQTNKG